MRKIVVALIILAVISPAVFAQNETDDGSGMYYVNVSVEKIYPTSQGYVIQYRTQRGFDYVGIPNRWFFEAAGKAGIIHNPVGSDWPTMSVFYNHGEFTHVRLYVNPSKGHLTWGSIPQGTDVSRFFSDEDTIQLKF